MSASESTPYGFQWGPFDVTRLASYVPRKGRAAFVLGVKTGSHDLEVYTSKTGKVVRVWLDGKELT